MLAGKVPELELAGILIVLFVKGEAEGKTLGFIRRCSSKCCNRRPRRGGPCRWY